MKCFIEKLINRNHQVLFKKEGRHIQACSSAFLFSLGCCKKSETRRLINNRNFFNSVLKAEKFKIKVTRSFGVCCGPASWFIDCVFTLYPHIVQWAVGLLGSLIGAIIPYRRALFLGLNHLPKAPPSNTRTLVIRFQHMTFGGYWGTQTFSHSREDQI